MSIEGNEIIDVVTDPSEHEYSVFGQTRIEVCHLVPTDKSGAEPQKIGSLNLRGYFPQDGRKDLQDIALKRGAPSNWNEFLGI